MRRSMLRRAERAPGAASIVARRRESGPGLDPLEQLDLLAFLQRHDGLFPWCREALALPHLAGLPAHVHDVDGSHVHLEDLLHRALYFDLVRRARNFKGVLAAVAQHRRLLRDDW